MWGRTEYEKIHGEAFSFRGFYFIFFLWGCVLLDKFWDQSTLSFFAFPYGQHYWNQIMYL